MTSDSTFISIEQFLDIQKNEGIKLIDSSWHMPNLNKKAIDDYKAAHIEGAQFFDLDEVADLSIPLPHMLPSAKRFAKEMDKMGISNQDHVVIYDSYGFFSSARMYWTFKIMGHDKVSILNGGLKKWLADGHPVTDEATNIVASNGYQAQINQDMVMDYKQLNLHIDQNDRQILDARSKARFDGTAPEPRPELSSGHMPNSFNLSFDQLSNEDGTIKTEAELKALVDGSGIDISKPIITTCGSGITASNLYVALKLVGATDIALYDGSWTEYASIEGSRIEKIS